tara:strand:- start:2398 stop:3141 length:744 start_codon:yes stop_codon:yes gene_type:complete
MKNLFVCLLVMVFGVSAQAKDAVEEGNVIKVVEVSSSMSMVEKKVRQASVRVLSGNGHGSGSLIEYYDLQLVVTAQHVASGAIGSQYMLQSSGESVWGVLVHSDPVHDIAVLYVINQFQSVKPMKWKPVDEIAEISTEITYSGFPSWHSLMTYRGRVAGYEELDGRGTQIMLNTYGWFGCSGSVIYNSKGQVVGILWGVDVEKRPDLQVQENMVWVVPVHNLDMQAAIQPICVALPDTPKACSINVR